VGIFAPEPLESGYLFHSLDTFSNYGLAKFVAERNIAIAASRFWMIALSVISRWRTERGRENRSMFASTRSAKSGFANCIAET